MGDRRSPARDGARRRVLIVEDDGATADLIGALLRDEGYEVAAAVDGRQALAMDGSVPDLVVLDMFMPGISGTELADALRVKYGTDVPFLVVSASHVADEASLLGAVGYVAKPFELDELVKAVRRVLPA